MANGWHRRRDDAAARARAAEYRTPEYRAIRAAIKKEVDAGRAFCWRCGKKLIPGDWHCGHSDDRSVVMGGECRKCNLSAAAQKGSRVAKARKLARSGVVTALKM